jgi:hypothetical protein
MHTYTYAYAHSENVATFSSVSGMCHYFMHTYHAHIHILICIRIYTYTYTANISQHIPIFWACFVFQACVTVPSTHTAICKIIGNRATVLNVFPVVNWYKNPLKSVDRFPIILQVAVPCTHSYPYMYTHIHIYIYSENISQPIPIFKACVMIWALHACVHNTYCIYIIYTHTYLHIYIHTYIHAYMYTYTNSYTYTANMLQHIPIFLGVCRYLGMTCMCTYTYCIYTIYTHTYLHINIHTYIHTYIYTYAANTLQHIPIFLGVCRYLDIL